MIPILGLLKVVKGFICNEGIVGDKPTREKNALLGADNVI
jgi:hypothetical protein